MSTLAELRDMSNEDLLGRVAELDEEVFRLRLKQGLGGDAVPHKMRALRRERARAKTLLRERAQTAEGNE